MRVGALEELASAQYGGSRWVLSSPEIGVTVRAPSEIRSIRVDTGTRAISIGGPLDGQLSSFRQASEPRKISLTAEWRADHSAMDIRPAKVALEKLARHDTNLGRPPRVIFLWGGAEQVDGEISELTFQWADGVFAVPPYYPRAFFATFSVSRKIPRFLESSARFQRETKSVTVGSGETFEGWAMKEYGDPYLGVNLRRTNPQISLYGLQPRDTIRMLGATHEDMTRSTEPISPALLGDPSEYLQRLAVERLSTTGPGYAALVAELGL